MQKNKKEFFLDITAIAALLLLEVFYFRTALISGKLFGDGADTRLIGMLLEHWHDVFTGRTLPLTPRMFWPIRDSLSYSDVLLGPGVIFSIFRFFGLSPFSAYNPTLFVLHFIGVFFLYLTLRRLNCSRLISIIGIFFSFWSCSFSQLTWHTQFFSLSFISVFFYGLVLIYRQRHSSFQKRLPPAIFITLSIGLTYLSAFYAAFLFTFYSLIGILIFVLLLFITDRSLLSGYIRTLRKHIKELLLYALLQSVWLIPLLIIYLPAFRRSSPNYGFTLAVAPDPWDIVRTFSYAPVENLLAGILPFHIDADYQSYGFNRLFETSYGYPLIVFLLFLWVILSSACGIRKKEKKADLLFSMSAALLILHLLSCRYGNILPWSWLKWVVPGSSVIRAPGRLLAIMTLPLSIILCCKISDLSEKCKDRYPLLHRTVLLILCLVLLLTGQCRRTFDDTTDTILTLTDAVSAPPDDCRVLLLIDPLLEEDPYVAQMNAYIIADHFDLYTINGYSGSSPVGWYLTVSDLSDYLVNAEYWLEANGITDRSGIYLYLTEEDQWIPYPDYL